MKKIKIKIQFNNETCGLPEVDDKPFMIVSMVNAVEVRSNSNRRTFSIGDRLRKEDVDTLCHDRNFEVTVTVE